MIVQLASMMCVTVDIFTYKAKQALRPIKSPMFEGDLASCGPNQVNSSLTLCRFISTKNANKLSGHIG